MPLERLATAIADATRRAILALFREHPGHTFYHCILVTTAEGHAPTLSAWSTQALEARVDAGEEHADIKWSYADSPFFAFGEAHFDEVQRLFDARPQPQLGSPRWDAERAGRLAAMEAALARLDAEGLFGTGDERLGIVINCEVVPPDYTNTERALRLNPRAALDEWLEEAAEPMRE